METEKPAEIGSEGNAESEHEQAEFATEVAACEIG